MTKIKIRNSNKSVKTKDIRSAAKFYIEKLLSKRLADNIELTIVIGKIKDANTKGEIDWIDRPVKPRQFKIYIQDKYKTKHTLLILAHELTHLKQMATGELCDETTRSRLRWKRKEIDMVKVDYFDLPYEIEAFGREAGLYWRWVWQSEGNGVLSSS